MNRFITMVSVLFAGSTAVLAQYTNILENATTQVVSSAWANDSIWVGDTTADNMLQVVAGGQITSSNVYVGATGSAYENWISMTETSRMDLAGQLVIGSGRSNTVSVSNGAVLTARGLELGSFNTLMVNDGGSVSNLVSMNVYSNATVAGQGSVAFGTNDASLVFHGGDIRLGSNVVFEADAGAANTLAYKDGALDVTSFRNAQFVNFGMLELQDSALTGTGMLGGFDTIHMAGGMIDPAGDANGSLEISSTFSASGTTYRAQVDSEDNDALIFSGADPVDLSGLNLDLLVSGTTTGSVSILTSAGGISNDFAVADIVSRPLLYSAELQVTNNTVQVVMAVDSSTVLSSMLDYAAAEGIRSGFSGMKNMVFTRTKQLRRNLVSTAHAIPNEVFLLTSTNAPAGPEGPGDQNTIFDKHIWIQHYNGQADYNRMGSATEDFTMDNNGTTIGMDKLIGDALLVGFNYTYARSAADSDLGNSVDTETYWIGAYGEWVDYDGLYVDALLGYGYSSYDSVRSADSYRGQSSYNGHAFGAYADVGQYYYYADSLALSPYMGLHALAVVSDAHDEVEDAGSVVHVGESDYTWLESALGLKLRHRFDTPAGRFQTTGYAEWSYDFMQDEIYSSLSSGGLAAKDTEAVVPDESGINAGLGFSWICTDYMEVGLGYNGRFRDHVEEHTGSLMLDIMF